MHAKLRSHHLLLLLAVVSGTLHAAKKTHGPPDGPPPGSVYREYAVHNGGGRDWRVTDPRARAAGAKAFLPNPVLRIEIGDLQHAIRAEVLLDRWGGHPRTTAKRIRFNQNAWILIPEISTVPHGQRAEDYYSQDNPVVALPLEHLRQGENILEATCSALDNYDWGQWGLYSAIVRIYYDPAQKPHPRGRIVNPVAGDQFGEDPLIRVEADEKQNVSRIDLLAWYDGYDENGDGRFQDWHRAYFQPLRGEAAAIREHVGTLWREPYQLHWNTRWVPDQPANSIRLIARIQDGRGIWYVTDEIEELSLLRTSSSVRMYAARTVPARFGARAGRTASCTISLPSDALEHAAEAVLALRTWHGWDGHHQPLNLNEHRFPTRGKNHHYDYDLLPIPLTAIKSGANTFRVHSYTEHHMLEVLWPGPALLVRYVRP